jgi:hypothetical protein
MLWWGMPQFQDDRCDIVMNPVLIGEVLSKSMRDYDRGDNLNIIDRCNLSKNTY